MKIRISDERKLGEIQEEFHRQFPFLKIEFSHLSNSIVKSSQKNSAINGETTIGVASKMHSVDQIYIEPQQSVSEIKKLFRDKYGLQIQVSRNSGNAWIPSTATDYWTLHEQNKQGEMLSTPGGFHDWDD